MGVLIDDNIHNNPALLNLTPSEGWLWLMGLSWLRHEKPRGDYVIPAPIARGLAASHGCREKDIDGLVSKGRWHKSDGGYEVHGAGEWDYRNPAVRGRLGGRSKREPNAEPNAEANANLTPKQTPKQTRT